MKGQNMEFTLACLDAETVIAQRIIPFWYRGSMRVDQLKGNGSLTDLEQSICEFEQWAAQN